MKALYINTSHYFLQARHSRVPLETQKHLKYLLQNIQVRPHNNLNNLTLVK